MNASTILDVFQHNVFAIGYLCVAGNTISTLRTAAEPFYKFFVAFVENTWFFLTKGWLYVVLGSIILTAGVITGLYRALRIRYGEYDPFPSDKVKNALNFGISFFLRAGIFSSIFLWIFALDTSDEIGDGAAIGYGIVIGIGLGLVYLTFPGVLPLGGKTDNAKIPVNEILVGILVGGSFGLVLCLFGIGFILSGLATKDATIIGAFLFIPFVAIIGGIIGGMIHGLVVISRFVTLMLHRAVFLAGSRLVFRLLRFKTIICQHCLRYTVPFRSHYREGIRYCEHCQKEVERMKIPGKAALTIGELALKFGNKDRTQTRRMRYIANNSMEHSENAEQVVKTGFVTKTILRKVNEDIRIYRRVTDWKALAKSLSMVELGIIMIVCLIAGIGIGTLGFTWKVAIGTAAGMGLVLTLARVIDKRNLNLHRGAPLVIEINRAEGTILTKRRKWGIERIIERYPLQEFEVVRLAKRIPKKDALLQGFEIIELCRRMNRGYFIQDEAVQLAERIKKSERRSYEWAVMLSGQAWHAEIFRVSQFTEMLRAHCHDLAAFLNLELIDESPSGDISDGAQLSSEEENFRTTLLAYARREEDIRNILVPYAKKLETVNYRGNVYIAPNIPEQKLRNAMQNYEQGIDFGYHVERGVDFGHRLLILIDSGKSGAKGAVITDTQIYLHLHDPHICRVEELSQALDEQKHRQGLLIGRIVDPFVKLGISANCQNILAQLLKELAEYGTETPHHQDAPDAVVEQYAASVNHDRVFFTPLIPETSLKRAIHNYAYDYPGDDEAPLVLIEADREPSGRGTTEKAFITTKHLYAQDVERKHPVKRDIVELSGFRIYDKNIIYAQDEKLLDLGLPQEVTIKLAQLLQTLAAYLNGTPENADRPIPLSD